MKHIIAIFTLLALIGCGSDSSSGDGSISGSFSSPVVQSFTMTTGSSVAEIKVKKLFRMGTQIVIPQANAASTKTVTVSCAADEQVDFSSITAFTGGSAPDFTTSCTGLNKLSQNLSDHVMDNISGVKFRRYYSHSGGTVAHQNFTISNFNFASSTGDTDNAITLCTLDGTRNDSGGGCCNEDYFFFAGSNTLSVRSRSDADYCSGSYPSSDDANYYMNNGFIEVAFDGYQFNSDGDLLDSSGSAVSKTTAFSSGDYFIWNTDGYCESGSGPDDSVAKENPTEALCNAVGGATWTAL